MSDGVFVSDVKSLACPSESGQCSRDVLSANPEAGWGRRDGDMSFTVNLRDDLPDEIKDLIARISVRHGQLEHVLAMTIKRTSPGRSLSETMARAQYLLNQPALTEEAMQIYGKDTDDQEAEAEFLDVLNRARKASTSQPHPQLRRSVGNPGSATMARLA